jgi:hypothetical protein
MKAPNRFALLFLMLIELIGLVAAGRSASAQGKRSGCEVIVYWDNGYGGEQWRTTDDQQTTGPHWAKQISSIIIISGIWDFYWDANYHGEVLTLPPGTYSYVGDHWNDKINSFRCVRPTG